MSWHFARPKNYGIAIRYVVDHTNTNGPINPVAIETTVNFWNPEKKRILEPDSPLNKP